MNYFVIVAIAISLSMDAFSMAMSIGTLRMSQKENLSLAGLVGLFHFVMPFLGTFLGRAFVANIHLDVHLLAGAIFLYIAILMFKDFKKGEDDEEFKVSVRGAFLFALGVSLDSFGVGFALQLPFDACFKSFLIFSGFSAFFTYVGLKLGKFLNSLIGEYSVLFGSLIMTGLGLMNIGHIFF